MICLTYDYVLCRFFYGYYVLGALQLIIPVLVIFGCCASGAAGECLPEMCLGCVAVVLMGSGLACFVWFFVDIVLVATSLPDANGVMGTW